MIRSVDSMTDLESGLPVVVFVGFRSIEIRRRMRCVCVWAAPKSHLPITISAPAKSASSQHNDEESRAVSVQPPAFYWVAAPRSTGFGLRPRARVDQQARLTPQYPSGVDRFYIQSIMFDASSHHIRGRAHSPQPSNRHITHNGLAIYGLAHGVRAP